jgi:glucan endo-1,3-alpha-glucosidase
MTAAMCTAECSDQSYTYAAMEYGVECYCGNNIESNGSGVSVDGSQCNMACGGIFLSPPVLRMLFADIR